MTIYIVLWNKTKVQRDRRAAAAKTHFKSKIQGSRAKEMKINIIKAITITMLTKDRGTDVVRDSRTLIITRMGMHNRMPIRTSRMPKHKEQTTPRHSIVSCTIRPLRFCRISTRAVRPISSLASSETMTISSKKIRSMSLTVSLSC